jgi:FkbM family methyltransferase
VARSVRSLEAFLSRVWSHPANRGRRVHQLAHAVKYQVTVRRGKEFVTPIGNRSQLYALREHPYSSLVVYSNPPDLAEVSAWRRILRTGDRFVDVGANVGAYTIIVAELGCRVLAVEPDPTARAMLEKNLALNDLDAKVVEGVLADQSGWLMFSKGRDATNTISIDGEARVRAMTLDDLVHDHYVAGVKVDVEGAERLVLEGARRALSDQRIGALQLEWNNMSETNFDESRDRALAILRNAGYRTYRPRLDGTLVEVPRPATGADIFALPSGAVAGL